MKLIARHRLLILSIVVGFSAFAGVVFAGSP